LFTHYATWQPKGLAVNLTLTVNLYHWLKKEQSFGDGAHFFQFENRRIGQGILTYFTEPSILMMGCCTTRRDRESDQQGGSARGGSHINRSVR
jgi:hypothetical protein